MRRNSLFVYFGNHLLVLVLLSTGGGPSNAEQLSRHVDLLGNHPQASFVIVMLVWCAGLAAALHRRRIYLRP